MIFRFRLQQALRVVELEEMRKKMEIGRVRASIDLLNRRIETLKRNMRHVLGMTLGKIVSTQWSTYQAQKIDADSEALTIAERNAGDIKGLLGTKTKELAKIMMKKKALERKKETDRRLFRLHQGRKEQKRLDDDFRLLSNLRKNAS